MQTNSDVKCIPTKQLPVNQANFYRVNSPLLFRRKQIQTHMTQEQVLTESDIHFVQKLTVCAGLRAIEMRDGVSVSEKTGPDDPVTSADIELSKILVNGLKERFSDEIISEEDKSHPESITEERVWLIDPIDGTKSYISRNGQYSVMLGLLINKKPAFGFVYEAEARRMYFGGPGYGAFVSVDSSGPEKLTSTKLPDNEESKRIIMGSRDRRKNPWVEELECVKLIKTGSIGLKVARILEEKADVLVHLSGRLKAWDTAGPAAIALGGEMEVGSFSMNNLNYNLSAMMHEEAVIMGRLGCLDWCKKKLVKPN